MWTDFETVRIDKQAWEPGNSQLRTSSKGIKLAGWCTGTPACALWVPTWHEASAPGSCARSLLCGLAAWAALCNLLLLLPEWVATTRTEPPQRMLMDVDRHTNHSRCKRSGLLPSCRSQPYSEPSIPLVTQPCASTWLHCASRPSHRLGASSGDQAGSGWGPTPQRGVGWEGGGAGARGRGAQGKSRQSFGSIVFVGPAPT